MEKSTHVLEQPKTFGNTYKTLRKNSENPSTATPLQTCGGGVGRLFQQHLILDPTDSRSTIVNLPWLWLLFL